ncbi:MAG: hypothetical protein IIU83_05285 [Fibrobacteraceae bacterium]|nr:hypothetical protein [Fibrobacteraceae bacterium]
MVLDVFFSWQVETNNQGFNNKKFLTNCIHKAFSQIQNKGELKNVSFRLHSGLDGEAGHPSVAQKMYELIDVCDIFIGDMTVTQKRDKFIGALFKKWGWISTSRKEPNKNVFGEFNRALGKYQEFEQQLVLVQNDINGKPDEDITYLPFDARERRFPISFHLESEKEDEIKTAENELLKDFAEGLRLAAKAALKYKSNKYLPFISLERQFQENNFSGGFIWTDTLNAIKEQILKNDGVVCVLGLSGMGKTRLIMECFRDNEMNDHYLYCDCNTCTHYQLYEKIKYLFKEYKESILVLDNCDGDVYYEIKRIRSGFNASNKIIIINNDLNNRSSFNSCNIIEMEKESEDVVDKILERFSELLGSKIETIKRFACGNPLMAELLKERFKEDASLENLCDDALVSKLLGVDKEIPERIVAQSLSLFDFLGYKEERRGELETVALSKEITCYDGKISNDVSIFDKQIAKYLEKGILEEKGRSVGMRPIPLAIYLIEEWLLYRTPEKLKEFIEVIQKAPQRNILTNSFCRRFELMGYNYKARDMVNQLLGDNSPFADAEVIDSELGSRLFCSFVNVNPVAVSRLYTKVFGNMSKEDLLKIETGRRNIVWTLEKLCFAEETFESGASLMLQFANAENETWSNNATGEFTRLFTIYLHATSVNLERRSLFLKDKIRNMQNKHIVLKALSSALTTSHFVYYGGAEQFETQKRENYEPKNKVEVENYIKACLDLVVSETQVESEYTMQAEKIIVDSVAPICRFGFGSIILPIINELCEKKGNDWDDMREKMKELINFASSGMDEKIKHEYQNIINKLTKTDFVSRFKDIQKECFDFTEDISYEQMLAKQDAAYENLAKEFLENDAYSKSILEQLMLVKVMNAHPFGKILADGMDETKSLIFANDSVDILNNNQNAVASLLIDFFASCDNQVFEKSLDILRRLNNQDAFFIIVARREFALDTTLFLELKQQVETGRSTVSCFESFWNYSNVNSWSTEKITAFFEMVNSLPNGFSSLMKICNSYLCFSRGNINAEVAKKILGLIDNNIGKTDILDIQFTGHNISVILKVFNEEEFAKKIHGELMNYVISSPRAQNNYEVSELYSVLSSKYFKVIWPNLSERLLSCSPVELYTYTSILGTTFSSRDNYNRINLFDESRCSIFMNWCEQHPDKAPPCLIEMIPVIEMTNDKQEFTNLAKEIVFKYGNDKIVLDKLDIKLNSYMWSGSLIPMYEGRINALQLLLGASLDEVKKWAEKEIDYFERLIKKEKELEEEGWR